MAEVLSAGAPGNPGGVHVLDGRGALVFEVDGSIAKVAIGVNGNEGVLTVRDKLGRDAVWVYGGGDIVGVALKAERHSGWGTLVSPWAGRTTRRASSSSARGARSSRSTG